ncbi:hypothetical protein [Streptomyces sp. NPDC060333]|uniref:hypothetical protein n=1 Tax=Streptomyces sp. NPDC060333 TaxID=3347098 RepID=UPI0036474EF6
MVGEVVHAVGVQLGRELTAAAEQQPAPEGVLVMTPAEGIQLDRLQRQQQRLFRIRTAQDRRLDLTVVTPHESHPRRISSPATRSLLGAHAPFRCWRRAWVIWEPSHSVYANSISRSGPASMWEERDDLEDQGGDHVGGAFGAAGQDQGARGLVEEVECLFVAEGQGQTVGEKVPDDHGSVRERLLDTELGGRHTTGLKDRGGLVGQLEFRDEPLLAPLLVRRRARGVPAGPVAIGGMPGDALNVALSQADNRSDDPTAADPVR